MGERASGSTADFARALSRVLRTTPAATATGDRLVGDGQISSGRLSDRTVAGLGVGGALGLVSGGVAEVVDEGGQFADRAVAEIEDGRQVVPDLLGELRALPGILE